jgi:hypothetical protein
MNHERTHVSTILTTALAGASVVMTPRSGCGRIDSCARRYDITRAVPVITTDGP